MREFTARIITRHKFATALFVAAVMIALPAGETVADSSESDSDITVAVPILANFSGDGQAIKIVLPLLLLRLENCDVVSIRPENLRPTLRKYRIRSMGRMSAEDAHLLQQETGAEYILLGSVNTFETEILSRVSLSFRLVHISTMRIVWAMSDAAVGREFSRAFGVREVLDMEDMAWRVIDRIFTDFDKRRPGLPSKIYATPKAKIAVVPFDNTTGNRFAGEVVSDMVLSGLVQKGFAVVEPGNVNELLVKNHIESRGEIDLPTLAKVYSDFGVDWVVTGSVLQFSQARGESVASQPEFEFGARLIDAATGRIVATYNDARGGNDSETIFGMGRCWSLGQLARKSLKGLIKKVEKENRKYVAHNN